MSRVQRYSMLPLSASVSVGVAECVLCAHTAIQHVTPDLSQDKIMAARIQAAIFDPALKKEKLLHAPLEIIILGAYGHFMGKLHNATTDHKPKQEKETQRKPKERKWEPKAARKNRKGV